LENQGSLDNEGMCFACGKRNPIGLHLDFRFEGDEYVTEFVPQEVHQGFPGIIHGGLIATVLASTDAVLLSYVVNDRRLPRAIRHTEQGAVVIPSRLGQRVL